MAVVDPEWNKDIQFLRLEIEALKDHVERAESRAEIAEHAAHQAEQQVLHLRDQIAAAQRDQQDLKTTRARLARSEIRGLVARILNRRWPDPRSISER